MRYKHPIRLTLLMLVLFGVSQVTAWAGESFIPGDKVGEDRDKSPRDESPRDESPSIAQRFLGERLDYHLGVFWFSHAADCEISFQRDEFTGQYVASMWAKTRGFVGWMTNYRENRYVSYMEEVEDGRRLRPILFEKMVTIGSNVNQSLHWFDYQARRIYYAIMRNHQLISQNCDNIPEGVIYEDILSAFYNFRVGVFGDIKEGETYQISSIPDKGIDKYTVEVLTEEQEQNVRRKQGWEDDTGFILKIKVSKDIFGTREGLIWGWMSEDFLPLTAVAEDAVGLGDVTGRLNQASSTLPQGSLKDGFLSPPDSPAP